MYRCDEALGGDGDPSEPIAVERERRFLLAASSLHFDEGERPATPGDHVDFAAGNPRSSGEDPPPVQAQIPAGEGFGAAAALLGRLAFHLADRSRARA